MANVNAKSLSRQILLKVIGVILALIFIPIGVLFLVYPVFMLALNEGGHDAKIAQVTNHFHKITTGCRLGGLFTADTVAHSSDSGLDKNVYCLYPAFPEQLSPSKGDTLRVWPAKKPVFGAPIVEGWGWLIAGTLFVLGLVLVEFGVLSLKLS